MGCLYILESPSQKCYIGISSKTLEERWHVHNMRVREGRDHALQKAIRKYGAENFKKRVLVVANDWKYLCELEKKAIAIYNTRSPFGYNLTAGGEGVVGTVISEESRRKMSEGQKRRFQNPDQLEMLSKKSKKMWDNDDGTLREKLKKCMAKKSVKKKLSIAAKKQFSDPEQRKIASLNTKKFFEENPDVRENISEIIRNKCKDPEYRKMISQATKAAMARPEIKNKVLLCARKRSQNPEWRKKISASKKGRKTKPCSEERKLKISEARKREWADPIMRAKRIEARRKPK